MSLDFYPKRKGGQGFTVAVGIVVTLLLGLLVWAGAEYARGAAAPFAAPPAAPVASRLPSATPAATANVTAAMLPTSTAAPNGLPAVQSVNSIAIELRGVTRAGESLTADLCYPFPTASLAWQLGDRPSDVSLAVGASTIIMTGNALIDWQVSPTGNKTGRCDHVFFTVPAGLDLTHFSLSVTRLMTSMSEGPDCGVVQDKLNRAGAGIVIACHPGAYSFGWEVVTRPVTLTASAANQMALDAFSDIVMGPWVFTASLPPA